MFGNARLGYRAVLQVNFLSSAQTLIQISGGLNDTTGLY